MMRIASMRRLSCLLAVLSAIGGLFYSSELTAWQPAIRFDRLTTEDGLPDEYVLTMAQDARGYLWFGTMAGLAKYDGHKFTVYRPDPDDPNSLASATVISVFVDRQDTLWVGTDVGLDRYERTTESFTHFRHDPEDEHSMGGNVVKEIFEDSRGALWVGHWFGGLSKLDRDTGEFQRYVHDPEDVRSLPAGAVFEITEDGNGNIWVGTLNGERTADAAMLDSASHTFDRVFTCLPENPSCPRPESPADRPENHRVVSIIADEKGAIWLGGGEITRYDPVTRKYKSFMHRLAPGISGGEIVADGHGGFWLTHVDEGLLHIVPETGKIEIYSHDPADPTSIVSDMLNKPFQDREGRIWLSAYNGGVSSFHPRIFQLGLRRYVEGQSGAVLPAAELTDVSESPDGSLWLVSETQVNRVFPERDSTDEFFPTDSLESGDCLGLFKVAHVDRAGTIWIGSEHGLCRFDPESNLLKRFPAPSPDLQSLDDDPHDYGVYGIRDDPDGYLWITTQLGLWRIDPATGERENYLTRSNVNQQEWGSHISAYLFEDKGRYWFGSTTALILLDINTGKLTKFAHDPGDPTSIIPGVVTGMVESHGYWVGTMTGIARFDPESQTFSPVFDWNGDHLGMIDDIVVDGDENLWISSSNGLWRLEPRSGELWSFGFSDGLSNPKMNEGHLLGSGEVAFVGGWGLNLFDPSEVSPEVKQLDVELTDFLLHNRPVPVSSPETETPLLHNLDQASGLELSWRDYIFAFEFAALEFTNPERVRYAYKLEGFDQEWIETDHRHRVATFTNIPPGHYGFRVRARYAHGPWIESEPPFEVTIIPPPWRTWWAYALYAFAGFAIITLIIRVRTETLRKRATELEQAVTERTRELRENECQIRSLAEGLEYQLERNEALIANISHEFRTPLTLILGPANRLLEKVEKSENHALLQMIRRNSRRMLRLVDQLLGLSRLKADQSLPREAQNVNASVDAICASFGPVAVERELSIDAEAEPALWVLCTPDTLDNIVLNLVSNAVKNTPPGGAVSIRARAESADWVELTVSDTGVGISPEDQEVVFERFHRVGGDNERQPGAGIGLALVKELAVEHSGCVRLESHPGQGTTVSVTLPRTGAAPGVPSNAAGVWVGERVALETEAAHKPEPGDPPLFAPVESNRPLVLVVEDNNDMMRYIVELLSQHYDCIEAENGIDAVNLTQEHVPDLVLCDIVLPGMDGFQVSHILKEDERTSHIPIILLTARHDRDSRMEGWKEHVDGYLTKPFSDEELLLRISNILAVREILKSRFTDRFFSDNDKNGMHPRDRAFLDKLESQIERHHADEQFGLEQMAAALYVSPRQLQRKLKAITGQSPAGFLRAFRLRKAQSLLRSGQAVGLVADAVGFASPAYFSSCFKAQFALSPSEYQSNFVVGRNETCRPSSD